jgi:hypothetical protein
MSIKSTFRKTYWVSQSATFLGGILIIVLFFYLSLVNDKIDFRNPFAIIAIVAIIALILSVLHFLFAELKQIIVSEKGIEINYLFNKKTLFIPFSEIKKISTKQIRLNIGNELTSGYQELKIELTPNKLITFNENQFSNYNELKNYIYSNFNH